jgi:hypothetical protein
MFIQYQDPDLDFIPIPDPGFKKAIDLGSGSTTPNYYKRLFLGLTNDSDF